MLLKKFLPGHSPTKRKQLFLSGLVLILVLTGIGLLLILWVDWWVARSGQPLIVNLDAVETCDCVIVPGALVYANQTPSQMLKDRLDVALQVYRAGKTDRILVSGDHGQKDYDEVNVMRQYLIDQGVAAEHVFMDHAGFDTYDTMYRARDVFLVRKAVVVTQKFHLLRALYIGEQLGMDVQGVTSDVWEYPRAAYYRFREYLARFKAFLDCQVLKSKPTFLGPVIPISGSGHDTLG